MKLLKSSLLFCLAIGMNFCFSQEEYTISEDSKIQEDVPRGTVTKHIFKSEIYDNNIREYYLYVPAQYYPENPVALMVFQDGHAYVKEDGHFKTPIVFDNLIHKKEMPVTIGLFINPGHNDTELPESPWRASNRSWEYDELSDRYIRFLTEEIIPEVSKTFNLTKDPKMRAICGLSSGGICAFTAAWQRPDYFQKVMSHIGSFTDIRGGHEYPALIRKTAKKDIKVYLQDGSNDIDNRFGSWWLANQQMAAALKFKDYDFIFIQGTGGHSGAHGGSVLPDALRWLWSN